MQYVILASVLADARSIVARVSTAWVYVCGSMHALRRRRLGMYEVISVKDIIGIYPVSASRSEIVLDLLLGCD